MICRFFFVSHMQLKWTFQTGFISGICKISQIALNSFLKPQLNWTRIQLSKFLSKHKRQKCWTIFLCFRLRFIQGKWCVWWNPICASSRSDVEFTCLAADDKRKFNCWTSDLTNPNLTCRRGHDQLCYHSVINWQMNRRVFSSALYWSPKTFSDILGIEFDFLF